VRQAGGRPRGTPAAVPVTTAPRPLAVGLLALLTGAAPGWAAEPTAAVPSAAWGDVYADADADLRGGRLAKAEEEFNRAVALAESGPDADETRLARSLNGRGILYFRSARMAEAEADFRRALELREKTTGRDSLETALALSNLAATQIRKNAGAEALPLYQRALAIRETRLGPAHPDVATNAMDIAGIDATQSRWDDAIPLYLRALSIRDATLSPNAADVLKVIADLARAYQKLDRLSDAEPLYRRLLAAYERTGGAINARLLEPLEGLAAASRRAGREAEAAAFDARIQTIRSIAPVRVAAGLNLGAACTKYYPAASRRAAEQGKVILLVHVTGLGRVDETRTETTSGFVRLDEAAATCVTEQGRFEPQKVNGKPVASWQRMAWTWRLST
jgi:TonB family protein